MKATFKRAITPRALEHWQKNIGFGNRLEIQAWQTVAKRPLQLANYLLPGKNPRIERSIDWLENRIEILQEDLCKGVEEFKLAIVKRKQLMNFLTAVGALLPMGIFSAGYYLQNVGPGLVYLGTVLGCGVSAFTLSHFGKNHFIRQMRGDFKARKTSEDKLTGLIEMLPEVVFGSDSEGRLTFVNRRGHELTGYTPADIEGGLHITDLLVVGDRDRAVEDLKRLTREKCKGPHDYTLQTRTAQEIPVMIHGTAVFENGGKPVGYQGIIVDMSERERAKRELARAKGRYEALFNNAPIGFHNTSPDGKILAVNNKWLNLLGCKREDVVGKLIFDFIVPEQRDGARARYFAGLAGESLPPLKEDPLYMRQDGARIAVRTYSNIVRNGDGKILYVQTSFEDITAQRKLEQETLSREIHQREISASMEVINSLIHALSQKFTVLMSIVSLLMIGMKGIGVNMTEEIQEDEADLNKAIHEIERYFSLFNLFRLGLRDGTMISGKDLQDFAKEKVEMIASKYAALEAKTEVIIGDGISTVRFAKEVLSLVMDVLLTNAFEAIEKLEPGEGKVSLTISKTRRKKGPGLLIVVADNGRGIAPEKMREIFKPFYSDHSQAESTKKGEKGLSLAYVGCLVERGEGKIDVESRGAGKGSKFRVWFPLKE